MKTKKLEEVTFKCCGDPDDTLTIVDDGMAVGFIPTGDSNYLREPDITAVIKRLKKIRKRIRARAEERMGL